MNRTLLGLILNAYLPTLLLAVGVFVALLAILLWYTVGPVGMYLPLGLLVVVLLFALGQMVLALRVYRARLSSEPFLAGFNFPAATIDPLPKLVAKVVRQRKLPEPHRILIAGTTEVFAQEEAGTRVLGVGGQSVTLLTDRVLAMVVAHALAHFTDPELAFLSKHRETIAAMHWTENWFRLQPGRWVNPFLWLLRGYHRVALSLYYARTRAHELRTDQAAVAASEAPAVAAAIVAEYTVPEVTFLRINAIADIAVKAGEKLDKIFGDHHEKAKGLGATEWENAFKKAMRRTADPLSPRPSLKDRLKALGVQPKQAFEAFQKESGTLFREEMPAWPVIEQKLIQLWVNIFRVRQDELEEYGAILST